MADVLIHADSIRSAEMRHEVPVPVPDPFLYVERNGRRVAVVTSFETERIGRTGVEALPHEHFGLDELIAGGMHSVDAELAVYTRACQELGVANAVVPPGFPLELADHLRANGIEVSVDRELFAGRRRRKNEAEIAGLRRAQRACESALDVGRDLLRRANVEHGAVVLDGEPLTVERIKLDLERVFSAHGCAAEEFIVAHGPQTAVGHDMGSGSLLAGEPITFDLFPRDRVSGVYSDMTRTYVVGEIADELREYHTLCKQALDLATVATKPGVNGFELMKLVCDLFAEHGYPTQLSKQPGEVLDSGFFHGLGHGVGLEVHEPPRVSRSGDDLVPGDVITLEPGLYRAGYGGVRLEDVLIVTDDGAEVVTDYPYELEP
jgi:Xaa-Pro aminopeptidase